METPTPRPGHHIPQEGARGIKPTGHHPPKEEGAAAPPSSERDGAVMPPLIGIAQSDHLHVTPREKRSDSFKTNVALIASAPAARLDRPSTPPAPTTQGITPVVPEATHGAGVSETAKDAAAHTESTEITWAGPPVRGAAPKSSARRFAPRGAIAGRLPVVLEMCRPVPETASNRQCTARQPTEPTDRPERRQHRHLRTVRVPIQPQPGLGTSRMVPATLQTSIPTAARTQPGKPSPDEYNRQVGGGHIGGGTSSPRPRTHTSELMARRPYFEKQQDQHCWVHSINMVMGRKHMDVGKIFI